MELEIQLHLFSGVPSICTVCAGNWWNYFKYLRFTILSYTTQPPVVEAMLFPVNNLVGIEVATSKSVIQYFNYE